MGLLGALARGLTRGADRTAAWTSKRGPRSFYKSRGAQPLGRLTGSRKFRLEPERVPRLVVPVLAPGGPLKAYVSYRAPPGAEPAPSARALFEQAAAPAVRADLRQGRFDPQALQRYGFRPRQDGLFRLFPSNLVR
ncbi:large ribosomal subunit protein mL41 [Tiliqua scincoides]|uniref:large ribosomal subunit protein mL41 n=1 Tax=Tiliqua scincoides TaxID=71010 RepID=UPI003461F71F